MDDLKHSTGLGRQVDSVLSPELRPKATGIGFELTAVAKKSQRASACPQLGSHRRVASGQIRTVGAAVQIDSSPKDGNISPVSCTERRERIKKRAPILSDER